MRGLKLSSMSVLLICFGLSTSQAQTGFSESEVIITDSISIGKEGTKEVYHLGMATLTKPEAKELLSSSPEALSQFRGGQAWNVIGAVTCVGGGFLFGFSVGQGIANSLKSEVAYGGEEKPKSMNWAIFGSGIGTLAAGALMMIYGKNLRVKAISRYNSELGELEETSRLFLRPSSNGLGLALVF